MRKLLYISAALALFSSCEPEFNEPVDEVGFYDQGELDLTHYVALGNSLSSGYADGALYLDAQQSSFPNILASKFALAGGGDFTQPLMNDNIGGLLLNGTPIASTRLVLNFDQNGNPIPVNLEAAPTTEVSNILEGPFNNMAVPGAKSFHLVAPGYGNLSGIGTTANPYFARMASSSETTVLADAVAQNPTFFSLWIGSNDILGYALAGGTGEDQTGNIDPTTYGINDITDPNVYAAAANSILTNLTANDAKGVVLNVPDVMANPFFTTIPNNALVLDANTAAQLTGFFQAVAGITTQGLINQGVPAAQAQQLAAQYAISFSEGPNRWIIDTEVTPGNPLGFRQMTEEELLLLTIDRNALQTAGYGSVAITPEVIQVLGKLQTGADITEQEAGLVLAAVNGIDDKDVLDTDEITAIQTARAAYNATLNALVQQNGLVMVDTEAILNGITNSGYQFNGGEVTAEFGTGGFYSLDGIHLTPRGYAILAGEIIAAINEGYNANIPGVDPGNYPTIFVQ